jgi:hypothetical protein
LHRPIPLIVCGVPISERWIVLRAPLLLRPRGNSRFVALCHFLFGLMRYFSPVPNFAYDAMTFRSSASCSEIIFE